MNLYYLVHISRETDVTVNQDTQPTRLLRAGDPAPLEIYNENGASDFFLICEHAGRRIPEALGTLGLSEQDRRRHFAWDIGARDIAVALSDLLDAPLYMQRYSRLVCDCNRKPEVASFIPENGEEVAVPGNKNVSLEERRAREDEIFWPFHKAVAGALDARKSAGRKTLLVTVHSFTPVFFGEKRPWEIGVLFNRDNVFSPAIAKWFQENTELCVGVNEPYAVGDETDYAIPMHGEKRGLPCVEFEFRNDLIPDRSAAQNWAKLTQKAIEFAARGL